MSPLPREAEPPGHFVGDGGLVPLAGVRSEVSKPWPGLPPHHGGKAGLSVASVSPSSETRSRFAFAHFAGQPGLGRRARAEARDGEAEGGDGSENGQCACHAPSSAGSASVPPAGGFEKRLSKREVGVPLRRDDVQALRPRVQARGTRRTCAYRRRSSGAGDYRHAHLHARRRLERRRRLLLRDGDADDVEHRRPEAHDRRSLAQDLHGVLHRRRDRHSRGGRAPTWRFLHQVRQHDKEEKAAKKAQVAP